jgi:hypothetical protein
MTHNTNRWWISFLLCFLVCGMAHGLPAGVLNPDVQDSSLNQTICTPGYTRTVRPSSSYTNGIKKRLLREKGMDFDVDKSSYELDHIIPLALGGHPRNLHNLTLQPWEGGDGAKRKDRLEVKLQCLVCSGAVALTDAREAIYADWKAAYANYGRMACKRKRGLKAQDYGD